MLFDTHCHLMDERFSDDLDAVITRAQDAGVNRIVVPGVDVATSTEAIRIAERFDGVFAAVGIHPESANGVTDGDFAAIRDLVTHPKVVAIGEIGLDYYWDAAPRDVQRWVMETQLEMAKAAQLPVVIHNRDATADTVQILTQAYRNGGPGGVMHCFTGSIETALQCINLGFFISFGGPLTFKNAVNVRETAAQVPNEWLLVETDSPYLTPHPLRGQRNEPAYVRLVADQLAEVKGLLLQEVMQMTTDNACRLFTGVGTAR